MHHPYGILQAEPHPQPVITWDIGIGTPNPLSYFKCALYGRLPPIVAPSLVNITHVQ